MLWEQTSARETPVESGVCIWCKQEPAEIRVGQEEHLCENCRGDLREFGRHKFVEFYVSSELHPTAQRIALDHYDAVRTELYQLHKGDPDIDLQPTVKSNASTYEYPAKFRDSSRDI